VDYELERAMDGADVIMPLRIQLERQEGNRLSSLREYTRDYAITRQRMERAADRAIVMHPGPMNEGVEIDPDVAHGERSVVQTQVTNGVAIRMAVLYLLMAAASADPLAMGRVDQMRRTGAMSETFGHTEPVAEASRSTMTNGAHA